MALTHPAGANEDDILSAFDEALRGQVQQRGALAFQAGLVLRVRHPFQEVTVENLVLSGLLDNIGPLRGDPIQLEH